MIDRPRADIRDGFYVWKKGQDVSLGKHFTGKEAQCQCSYSTCIEQRMLVEHMKRADAVRDAQQAPVTMTSGFRCALHQRDLLGKLPPGHTVPHSTHEQGRAWDLVAKDMVALRKNVEAVCKAVGVSKAFIHGDDRSDKVRRWTYP